MDSETVAAAAGLAIIVAAAGITLAAPEYEFAAGVVVIGVFAAVIVSPWLPGVEENVLTPTVFGVLLVGSGGFGFAVGHDPVPTALLIVLGTGMALGDQYRRRRRADSAVA